jgi:phosphate butyryltransferase
MIGTFQGIIEAAKDGGTGKRIAVPSIRRGDLKLLSRAVKEGLGVPLIIGDGRKMEALVKKSSLASLDHEILDVREPGGALSEAIRLVREGRADILMQGGLHRKAFLGAVLDVKKGLLKGRLASYASVFQLLKRDKLILVTDTFVNNFPGAAEKQLILENAIGLAGVLGMESLKVAALAAIEQVNPSISSTLDAAVLSKMSERKQFGNVIVEGPLDMDCALSRVAASRKGLKSEVTGNVDIYVVPDVETGYLLVQALVFVGKMKTAGILLGTVKPVLLDLPFVTGENRLVEIALASLMNGKGENRNG